jgi:hypothetical protein
VSCFGYGTVFVNDTMLCRSLLFDSFVVIKVIIGVNLLTYATRRQTGMDEREAMDIVNNFGRDPIGEGNEERVSFPCFGRRFYY